MWKKTHCKKKCIFFKIWGQEYLSQTRNRSNAKRLKCLNCLYWYLVFIQVYQLLNQFQISYINPLKVPDWLKHFHTHSWFLHYTLNIKTDLCFVHLNGSPTSKTNVTYKNTDDYTEAHAVREWFLRGLAGSTDRAAQTGQSQAAHTTPATRPTGRLATLRHVYQINTTLVHIYYSIISFNQILV